MSPEHKSSISEITPFKGKELTNTKLFVESTKDDEILANLLNKFFADNLHKDFLEELPKFPVKIFFDALDGDLKDVYTSDELKDFSARVVEITKKRDKHSIIPTINGLLFENLACAEIRAAFERRNIEATILSPKDTKKEFIQSYAEVAQKRPLYYNPKQGYAEQIYQYEYIFEGKKTPLYIPDGLVIFEDNIVILEYKKDITELKENQFNNLKTLKRILTSEDGARLRKSLAKSFNTSADTLTNVGSVIAIDFTLEDPEQEKFIVKETESEFCIGVPIYYDELATLRSSLMLDFMQTIAKK